MLWLHYRQAKAEAVCLRSDVARALGSWPKLTELTRFGPGDLWRRTPRLGHCATLVALLVEMTQITSSLRLPTDLVGFVSILHQNIACRHQPCVKKVSTYIWVHPSGLPWYIQTSTYFKCRESVTCDKCIICSWKGFFWDCLKAAVKPLQYLLQPRKISNWFEIFLFQPAALFWLKPLQVINMYWPTVSGACMQLFVRCMEMLSRILKSRTSLIWGVKWCVYYVNNISGHE